MSTLAIIPTYLREPHDRELLDTCVKTLLETAPDAEVLVVDDGSPRQELLDGFGDLVDQVRVERKEKNEGFAHTVNVGLREAREREMDAVLVNADIEFIEPWLEPFHLDSADIAGALLLYPNGTIQHAGVFFSRLHRVFDHRFRYGPGDLPEAQVPHDCIVTGALQFISLTTLMTIGLYDETFRMGFEDVDYCLRATEAGLVSRYLPAVRAYHHESVFRGRPSPKIKDWQEHSYMRLYAKWPQTIMLKHAVPVV